MIFDGKEWFEYVADDVPPGIPPIGKTLEFVQITTFSESYITKKEDEPWVWKVGEKNVNEFRTFWRLKDNDVS